MGPPSTDARLRDGLVADGLRLLEQRRASLHSHSVVVRGHPPDPRLRGKRLALLTGLEPAWHAEEIRFRTFAFSRSSISLCGRVCPGGVRGCPLRLTSRSPKRGSPSAGS